MEFQSQRGAAFLRFHLTGSLRADRESGKEGEQKSKVMDAFVVGLDCNKEN